MVNPGQYRGNPIIGQVFSLRAKRLTRPDCDRESTQFDRPPMVITESKIRLLIVDDHTVIREGLTLLLSPVPDLEVIGTASNGRDAVELVKSRTPDVVIMDLHMPIMDGADAMKELRATNPDIKLIVLSSYKERGEVLRAISSGANAYLLKDGPIDELAQAIRNAHAGRSSLNAEIASTVLSRLSELSGPGGNTAGLTAMELRTLELLRDGASNPDIAKSTMVSPNTVKSRLSRIYEKLSVTSRTQAVAEALRLRVINHE